MEGSGDDFVSRFHPTGDFDIRRSGDPGGDRDEMGAQFALFILEHEDSLNLLLAIGSRGRA